MQKKLADLQVLCLKLNLDVKIAGKRPAKDDYVKTLREHFMPFGGLPYTEVEPMLCFAIWNLKEGEQKGIWRSPNFVAQRKLNGCRLIVHCIPGKGVFAHSRTVSLKTYRYQELTDKLLISNFKDFPFEIVFDCEVMVEKTIDTRGYTAKGEVTKSSLHSTTSILHLESKNSLKIQVEQDAPLMFHVFDLIKYSNLDLRNHPLMNRMEYLEDFKGWIKNTEIGKYFEFPEFVYENKQEYCDKIIEEGGEGVILKNLRSLYEDSSSRGRDAWVKVKKRIEYDAYVTGFVRGEEGTDWRNLVGALEFSVMTEKGEHMLGCPTSMTLEFRKMISVYDSITDTVTMDPQMYGKVAEISGQDVTARVMRLSHCTLDRWRDQPGDEKSKEECVIKYADLKEASEWVG